MRYIDADKLKENAADKLKFPFYMTVADFADQAPTEDVAPIKHGKWLYSWSSNLCAEFKNYQGFQPAKCSVCNISQSINTYQHKAQYKYCPYCGAKMDEGE